MSRAQQLKTEIDSTLDDTIKVATNIENTSRHTLDTLQQQGEQIENINKNIKDINVKLSYSERLIRSIKSVSGAVVNSITRPTIKLPPSYGNGNGDVEREEKKKTVVVAVVAVPVATPVATPTEQDKYDVLLQSLQNIKQQANDINKTLNTHNLLLEEVSESVEWTDKRVVNNTKKITKLI